KASQSAATVNAPGYFGTTPAFSGSDETGGTGFGMILGLERKTSSGFLYGIEGDFSWEDRDTTIGDDTYSLAHWGTIRLRAGQQLTPSLSAFGSFGMAIADVDNHEVFTPIQPGVGTLTKHGSDHLIGLAATAGLEYEVWRSMRIRLEYMYVTLQEWKIRELQ